MKKSFYVLLIATLSLLCVSSAQGQNTEGTEFWLTFGKNGNVNMPSTYMIFQIRIVGGSLATTGTIYFTSLDEYIDFDIEPYGVYNYVLNITQMAAVYNVVMGKTNFSIHINTSYSVSVYAFNYIPNISYDATNVLPVKALGTEYYQISYTPPVGTYYDAYAVVATQNNTQIYHNDDSRESRR